MIRSLVGGIILALFGSGGRTNYERKLWVDREKAQWCKKYFKLQDIGSNYYFWRPDRQFGKFRTGFGFIRVRIRGEEQLYVFYRARGGSTAGDSCLKNEKQ